MKRVNIIILAAGMLLGSAACSKILEVEPKAVLSESQVKDQLDNFVIAAYSLMPGLGFGTTHNPWIQSVRSDDAYKGGGGLNDQTPWYEMEVFTAVTPNIGNNDGPWYLGYVGISRTNTALSLLSQADVATYPEKDHRIAEMRFLRGWIYLGAKLRWKYIPWIDESVPTDAAVVEGISNRPDGMTNDLGLWDKIIADFEAAASALPETQAEKGRPTSYAAHAFAAKALLFRAYEQNDAHQVVNVNKETLQKALAHIQVLKAKDGVLFDLEPDFANNFLVQYDNATKESVWEIQHSIGDGTQTWSNGQTNRGNELNAPWWAPYYGCCDFHKASHNLINAFKTDNNGLPDFDNFNNTDLNGNSYVTYFQSHAFDPRLLHTVGIPGYPWKYDNSLLYAESGSRAPFQYGYFNSLKEQVPPDCDCIYKPFYTYNSMNRREIRYAEVLLWEAEILIQLDRHQEALPIINRIRTRAANSTGRLKKPDGSNWMNWQMETYKDGVNCNWTKDFAWQALVWENRLEMAMEGRRFFDLQRWGMLEPVMNAYINKEKTRFDWFSIGHFMAGRDEYLPIPQAQMNWSKGSYHQNPGY